ncbi:DNA-binding transcriptional LysR family regulator [Bradyrhizobium diazoefficiens]
MAFIEAGTVVGAAELLRISQPAASKLLITLEEDSGLQLFERDSGRLIVTDLGMRLHQEVDRVFSGIHQIERAVELIRREDKGRLLIGVIPGLSGSNIRQAVAGLLSRHPNVYVSISERSSQIIVDWLIRRQLDVGIISGHVEHPGLETESLNSHPLVCLLPLGHRLEKKTIIVPTDLAGEPFVSFAQGIYTRLRIDEIFESHGLRPNVVLDASTAPNVCEFVAAGVGVTLLHPLFADCVSGRVAVRRFEPSTPFQFLLCWPRDLRNSKLVKAFIEEARKAARESSLQLATSP